jgi:predicted esterase
MRNRSIAFLTLSLFICSVSFSQQVYRFTKGLMITGGISRYGREALYTDLLAYKLYTNSMKAPAEGDSLGVSQRGQANKWQAVTADSLNRLRGRGGFFGGGGGGGYFYLTYNTEKAQPALLNIKGNNGFIFNGEPHAGDPYSLGWLYIPVQLKKGLNELYVRGGNIEASLIFPEKPVFLITEDPTLSFIVLGQSNEYLSGAVVLMNTTSKALKGLQIKSTIGGKERITAVHTVPPMSSLKIPFRFTGEGITQKGQHDCVLQLLNNDKVVDEKTIRIDAVDATDKYSVTFNSKIDGSLQYYAVTPQLPSPQKNAALFLSVHGAGVEAIGQARAYQSKDWGTLIAATNRRPRGFNWEDWGRLDALEVLEHARKRFEPDPQRIYLTGHSMGGHGTWFLGATYPDKWAAIAPCAGYPTLKGYGSADGLIPDSSASPTGQLLLRAGNQSDVIRLVTNYKPLGVYISHGDADRVVSVNYARQMRKLLAEFHGDMHYYEHPGGEHWFTNSVDWQPLFDFFKWHTRPVDTAVNSIDFMTANPGISFSYYWASVQQQEQPLQFSRIQLKRNRAEKSITGTTENARLLGFDMKEFSRGDAVRITLDGSAVTYTVTGTRDTLYLIKDNGKWTTTAKPGLNQKGPHRYGTFKDAFNNNMVFVYGTTGTREENAWSFNKARYDAETWYYRGNGAVEIIPDKEFSPEKYKDRGIIIFGNKSNNAAWGAILSDCPIQVERNRISAGSKVLEGDDLAAYFVWPLHNSTIASVGVVTGTGIKGMNAATANQYFAGASGFPDYMVFRLKMLENGVDEVKLAGFYDNNWKLIE